MSLTAEQFREIIRSLKSDGVGVRSNEKRAGPRVGLRCRLSIRSYRNGKVEETPTMVWLRDLSAAGIGIVHSTCMEDGDAFVAEFPLRNNRCLGVLYKVVHYKTLAKNLYSIGAMLEKIMTDEWK